MRKHIVNLTMIYNATIEVDAENSEEAMNYVENNLEELAPDSIFQKGEKTVDFADPVN